LLLVPIQSIVIVMICLFVLAKVLCILDFAHLSAVLKVGRVEIFLTKVRSSALGKLRGNQRRV